MSKTGVESDLKFWEYTALSALLFEIAGVGIYAWATKGILTFGILFLLALAATGAGGVLGFLFGVPRIRTDAEVRGAFLHNSNLEQISDWLTKIIIGATLVQVNNIGVAIGQVSLFIGREISAQGSATVACSVIVFSFFAGFMWAYLWISVRVRAEFDASGTSSEVSSSTAPSSGY